MSERPVIQVRELRKYFPLGKAGWFGGPEQYVRAIDGISFDLRRGEVLALVGESGCGKSTLALTLMGLEQPDQGAIVFEGEETTRFDARRLKAMRRRIQMVFQDPYESLNPFMSVGQIVGEPLDVHGLSRNRAERTRRIEQALEAVGLRPASSFIYRLPHELSGGQRQRVVIAAALALEPAVLLADEPVSMLDVSIRAEILNLLADLKTSRRISVLLITHDLGTVACLADRIAVMYLGRIVELGPTRAILEKPLHPYPQALISVIPVPNPRLRRERFILRGETPNPIDLPSGCRFHPRCPLARAHCRKQDPPWREHAPDHWAACHEIT